MVQIFTFFMGMRNKNCESVSTSGLLNLKITLYNCCFSTMEHASFCLLVVVLHNWCAVRKYSEQTEKIGLVVFCSGDGERPLFLVKECHARGTLATASMFLKNSWYCM